MDPNTSLIDRLLSQPRPFSIKFGISLLVLLLPFTAAALDGLLSAVLERGQWRSIIMPSVIVLYFWWIAPAIAHKGNEMLQAARSLVAMEEEAFSQLITNAAHTRPVYEWLAFSVGASLGILTSLASSFEDNMIWLRIYWTVGLALMYGLLALVIYSSFVSTRLNRAIHRQKLVFDIFDTRPFEPFARYSLVLAIAFVGGMTISLVLTFQVESLRLLEFWVVYLVLACLTLMIFILGMNPTHQVLSREKKREMEALDGHMLRLSRDLLRSIEQNQEHVSTAETLNALAVYERRLQSAQTWPYNTSMLRTLFFSVLIPLGSFLGREVLELLAGG